MYRLAISNVEHWRKINRNIKNVICIKELPSSIYTIVIYNIELGQSMNKKKALSSKTVRRINRNIKNGICNKEFSK